MGIGTIVSALVVAVAVLAAAVIVRAALASTPAPSRVDRTLEVMQLLAPAAVEGAGDPRAMLRWQPLVRTARQLYPEECAALDRAAGGAFPFSREQVQAAHAQWTADWLAWERAHDTEYKVRAASLEAELAASNGSAAARARLDASEREKLDLYQRRYQEYVQVGKALQALLA